MKLASVKSKLVTTQKVVIVADSTFFKRSFGMCVFRAPLLKKNLCWAQIQSETIDTYKRGRAFLEQEGFAILAVVLDGRPGVRDVFVDVPVQMCQFHQKMIINRYLTTRPRLEGSIELRKITSELCVTNEKDFAEALYKWHEKWKDFLKEKTINPFTGKWHYTHKRLRSAYRSLNTNLPYLFTYQKYPGLNIPNTTNSLEGSFSQLKELVKIHRGINKEMKMKIIDEILGK